MQNTRTAFLFKGKNLNIVTKVLEDLKGYKGVDLLDTVYVNQMFEIFKNNKSIITSDSFIKKCTSNYYEVYVDDPTQVLNINSTDDIRKQFKNIANSCNIDIGDHIANATKNEPATIENCIFCKYVKNKPKWFQEVIYSSPNFICFASMGQFLKGYLLIVPKLHTMSSAELSLEARNEMLEVIEDLSLLLKDIFHEDILIFENGSGQGGHGKDKSSIVHAHVHILPFKMDIINITANRGIPVHEIDYYDLPNYAEHSYLLIRDYSKKWYINYNHDLYIPRQYVRQLIANSAGIPGEEWNWRTCPFYNETKETGDIIQEYILSHKDSLPKRIIERTSHFVQF